MKPINTTILVDCDGIILKEHNGCIVLELTAEVLRTTSENSFGKIPKQHLTLLNEAKIAYICEQYRTIFFSKIKQEQPQIKQEKQPMKPEVVAAEEAIGGANRSDGNGSGARQMNSQEMYTNELPKSNQGQANPFALMMAERNMAAPESTLRNNTLQLSRPNPYEQSGQPNPFLQRAASNYNQGSSSGNSNEPVSLFAPEPERSRTTAPRRGNAPKDRLRIS